jgi:hypothetical protein
MMKITQALLVLGAATLLVACGSSSSLDDPVQPPVASNEVPASAMASVTSYTQYAGSLSRSESGAPLDVSKVVPPTSETALASPVT